VEGVDRFDTLAAVGFGDLVQPVEQRQDLPIV
jgi:hypothetical protein